MIELKKVCKNINGKEIIKNVSLEIRKGEIYGLIGISGAGKSTLLRMINGLETLSSGKIVKPKNIKYGFVFQHFNLVNSLNVYENIKLALIQDEITDEEKTKKIQGVLNLVGLENFENSYPKNLSGGQKQRVGIARALVSEVDVLLCDEATSALDPITAQEIVELLKSLNEKFNLTIIFVSHQLELVKDFCDHVTILHEGETIESGTTLSIFSKPKSKVTKELLSNILGITNIKDKFNVKLIICYGQDKINDCISQIIKKEVSLYAVYQHQTKQGVFAHIYVQNTDVLGKYQLRGIDG